VHTFPKEETKKLDGPKARRYTLPVKGNLSAAFDSISFISEGSFIDTRSCVGLSQSFTTDPYLSCDFTNSSVMQKKNYTTRLKEKQSNISLPQCSLHHKIID